MHAVELTIINFIYYVHINILSLNLHHLFSTKAQI